MADICASVCLGMPGAIRQPSFIDSLFKRKRILDRWHNSCLLWRTDMNVVPCERRWRHYRVQAVKKLSSIRVKYGLSVTMSRQSARRGLPAFLTELSYIVINRWFYPVQLPTTGGFHE